jgi:hypothetical protein
MSAVDKLTETSKNNNKMRVQGKDKSETDKDGNYDDNDYIIIRWQIFGG